MQRKLTPLDYFIIVNKNSDGDTKSLDESRSIKYYLQKMVRYMLTLLLLFFAVNFPRLMANMLLFYCEQVYQTYKIYIVDDTEYFVIGMFLFYCYFFVCLNYVTIIDNTSIMSSSTDNWKTQIKYYVTSSSFILCFIFYILFHTIIICLSEMDTFLADTYLLSNKNNISKHICDNYLRCEKFCLFYLILYVYIPGISPIIQILTLLIYNNICLYYQKRSGINNNDSLYELNTSVLFGARRSTSMNSTQSAQYDEFESENNDHDYYLNKYYLQNKKYCYYLFFLIPWSLFMIFLYIMINIQYDILINKTYWQYWYFILFITITICKFFFKKIVKHIDIIRIKQLKKYGDCSKNNDNEYKIYKYNYDYNVLNISFEWFVEILLTLIYWSLYRNYIILELVNLPSNLFILSIITNLISEFIQTSVKLTNTYYNIKLKLKSKLFYKWNCNSLTMINNDELEISTYIQWRRKQLIDIFIRFCVLSVTGIWYLLWLTLGYKVYYGVTKQQLMKALLYSFIQFIVDFLYFTIAGYIQLTINDFKVIFDTYCHHKYGFLMSFFVCVSFCVILIH